MNSLQKLLGEGSEAGMNANTMALSSIRNADVVYALGMVGSLKRHWSVRHNKALLAQTKASDRAGLFMASTRFIRMALQVLILGIGAYLAIGDEITPGTMIAASIIMGRALAPVDMAVGQWKNVVNIRGAFSRLDMLLKAAPAPPTKMALPEPKGHIATEDLFVSPPGSRAVVVQGVNFALQPGSSLAIIGPSGSGKSSLLKTLVGIWSAARGVVRYDGADLAGLDQEVLGPHIGFMPQAVELFEGTIAENIARFEEVVPEEVISAARKADIHELILKYPEGYETRLGQQGKALSGGERQRVALARALYKKPKIIILDEPNANLDLEGERALAAALEQSKKEGATIIVVSHRQTLLQVVDNVILLKDGKIIKSGPTNEILDSLSQN